VRAQAGQADAILARASRAYAGVRTLRADFEQSTENPVLRRTTTSRGTLFQSRPDRFAMRFSQPEGDRIVADGDYIWVYYPSVDAQQVIRMTAGAGGAGAVDLQAQFLGNPTERFDAVHEGSESVNGRAADVLTLTPRGRESFRSLKVWVDREDALVRRFEITEHNGVIRRFLLRNLTPGAAIDASTFQFTPPEGAHVVARG
jgi:outer membrane lipoprotein carrier protein